MEEVKKETPSPSCPVISTCVHWHECALSKNLANVEQKLRLQERRFSECTPPLQRPQDGFSALTWNDSVPHVTLALGDLTASTNLCRHLHTLVREKMNNKTFKTKWGKGERVMCLGVIKTVLSILNQQSSCCSKAGK